MAQQHATDRTAGSRYLPPTSRTFLGLLSMVTALQALGTTISLPALPDIADAFGVAPSRAQLTLSLYMAGLAAGQVLFGALSDRFGRRPVLLGAMSLFTLSGIVCTLAPDIDTLIAARAVQGFAGGAGMILGRAIVRDLFERDRGLKVMSVVVGVMTVVPMLAPFIGAAVLSVGSWRWVLAFLTLVAAVLTLATWRFIAESIRSRDATAIDPRRIVANSLQVLGRSDFVSFPLIAAFIFGGFFAYLAVIPFVASDVFGLSHAAAGWLTGINGLALWCGAITNNRLSGRWPVRRLLRFSTGLALGGAFACLAVTVALSFGVLDAARHPILSLLLLAIPVMAFTFSFGITQPNTIVMSLQPVPHVAGVASAMGATIQMAVAAVLIWLVGAAYDGTPLALGLLLAGAALVSFLVFHGVAKRHTPAESGTRSPPGSASRD